MGRAGERTRGVPGKEPHVVHTQKEEQSSGVDKLTIFEYIRLGYS